MPILGELQRLQLEASRINDQQQLGYELKRLNDAELWKWGRMFDRQFALHSSQRVIVDVDRAHQLEYMLGVMVAKNQMGVDFDGESPSPGRFGGTRPRAAYFGGLDDWRTHGSVTGGAAANWIHAGAGSLGGTAANDIKILENAVHVISALGSLRSQILGVPPLIESFEPRIEQKVKPCIVASDVFQQSEFAVKELDSAFILKKNTTFRMRIFQQATGQDIPYLWGVSYIPEANLREIDPANLTGTAPGIVTTT